MSPIQAAFILDVRTPVDPETLKSAYRRAVLRHHPDRGGDEADMRRVTEAYEVLRGGGEVMDSDPPPRAPRGPRGPKTGPGIHTMQSRVPSWVGDLLHEVSRPERAADLGAIVGADRVSAVRAGIDAFLTLSGQKRKK
jgi:hypothetical protein